MLHTLVSEAREGMTAAAVAVACQRDPAEAADIGEIEAALQLLLKDGLAERKIYPRRKLHSAGKPDRALEPDTPHQPLYRPTRAAIRANELSF